MPVLKVLADENFDGKLLNALKRRMPDLDMVRVQDVGLMETPDEEILAWAAQQGRLLLTHDVNTIPECAKTRIASGHPMPGVVLMKGQPTASVIEDLAILAECSVEGEWEGQLIYLPLR